MTAKKDVERAFLMSFAKCADNCIDQVKYSTLPDLKF